MRSARHFFLWLIVGAGLATTVQAHHSSAMFDKSRLRDVSATVKTFQWTNPHIWIQILITDEAGNVAEWSIEGGGTNTLFRRGWRPNSFKPGDEIRIRFNPMKDGSAAGGFVGARLADGRTLGSWPAE
ncbi:MAG: DUF6152 family protein [Pseudomonadota bacterium]